jgi:cytochrome c peroxidase
VKIKIILVLGTLFLLFTASKKTALSDYLNLPATAYNYAISLPLYFTTTGPGIVTSLINTPINNAITNDGATLGRVLFYDKNLSLNRTISCSSCHQQALGFSDANIKSIGFLGGITARHSMTLIDAKYYENGRFFWDERAATLEEQVLQPLQDATEMGLTLAQIIERVNEQTYYSQLFTNAFGDNTVTTDRVSKALAQFVRSIESFNCKYDVGRVLVNNPNVNFSNFTPEENQGKTLFFAPPQNGGGGCAGCHTTEAFAGTGPQNNGLDLSTTADQGQGQGRFKTGSIRNIELTAPYMHDGRFSTLEQVVEHYNSGVQAHPNLANRLKLPNGDPIRLNFTTIQKNALVAFLKTLTDNSIATEKRWSNPFVACVADVNLTGNVESGIYKSSNAINLSNGANLISSNQDISAKNAVNLLPPFEVKSGTVFKAQIEGCD